MTDYFWKFSTNVQENKKERERSSVSNPFEREALQPSTTERRESCKAMVIEVTQQLNWVTEWAASYWGRRGTVVMYLPPALQALERSQLYVCKLVPQQ